MTELNFKEMVRKRGRYAGLPDFHTLKPRVLDGDKMHFPVLQWGQYNQYVDSKRSILKCEKLKVNKSASITAWQTSMSQLGWKFGSKTKLYRYTPNEEVVYFFLNKKLITLLREIHSKEEAKPKKRKGWWGEG